MLPTALRFDNSLERLTELNESSYTDSFGLLQGEDKDSDQPEPCGAGSPGPITRRAKAGCRPSFTPPEAVMNVHSQLGYLGGALGQGKAPVL